MNVYENHLKQRINECEGARKLIDSLLRSASNIGLSQCSKMLLLTAAEEVHRTETATRKDLIKEQERNPVKTSDDPQLPLNDDVPPEPTDPFAD